MTAFLAAGSGFEWSTGVKIILITVVSLMLLATVILLVTEIVGKRRVNGTFVVETVADETALTSPEPEPEAEPAPAVIAEHKTDEELQLDEGAVVVDDGENEDSGVVMLGKLRLKVRYDRSFTAKLIQSDDILKSRYSELKCELMRYAIKPRMSWSTESFYKGRVTYAKFAIRGKTLSLYLALSPQEFENTKYKYEDAGGIVKYAKTPMRLKLRSERSVRWAKELIALLAGVNGLIRSDTEEVDYRPEYRDTTSLVHDKLIKLYYSGEQVGVIPEGEVKEEIAVAEIAENTASPAAERKEVVEESEPLPERGFEILSEVRAEDVAEAISDEEANVLVEEKAVEPESRQERPKKKKFGIVNVNSLSEHYSSGEKVTLESLKRKDLIAPSTTFYKVLADGRLDKPLIVEADDFSMEAVKMIVLTGGRVIHNIYKDEK